MDPFIKDCIGWDVSNWSAALDFWNKHADLPVKPVKCLELGANQGGLSLWLANRGYHVVCSDIKDPKLSAQALHQKYRVSDRIEYQVVDATNIPYTEHFDIVIFKSMLGGVGRNGRDDLQRKCIAEIHKCLKNEGKLLFAENLSGTRMHRFFRNSFVKWSKSWNYLEYNKIGSLLKEYDHFYIRTAGYTGLLGSNEAFRSVLGTIDRHIFNKIIAKENRYIVFGVAEK
ncbi:MAG: class I SAM-dependent methyltransferase [Bacteroidota bacterium]|nr:class I SAM-dependent methyltransferase [Bacteroidota bacterium]